VRPGRAFRALRYRDFQLLFAAFLLSQSGFWITHISLQGLMAREGGNDPLIQGLLAFVIYLPGFLLAPPAGLLADRVSRKAIALACQAGIALLSGGLAALVWLAAATPEHVLVLAFGLGVCFAFTGPAQGALIANSVPRAELGSAVSLHSALNNLTRVAGPALAAPLLATGRFELAFAYYALAVALAAGLVLALRVAPLAPALEKSGVLRRMWLGFEHARSRPPALPSLSLVAVLSLFGVAHSVLLPVFAERALGRMEWFAGMAVATGVGAIGGALTSGFRPPDLRAGARDLVLYGAALALFSLTRHAAAALLCQALAGYFYFSLTTNLQTLIQERIDDAMRGRVMSLFGVCWGGLVPFGGLAMGGAARGLGVRATIGIGAGVCIAYGLAIWWIAGRWPPQTPGLHTPSARETTSRAASSSSLRRSWARQRSRLWSARSVRK